MTNPGFDGKTALVTGGAAGIGAACVRQLVEAGAQVVVADRSLDEAHALAEQFGDMAMAVRADVRAVDDCEQMVRATVARFGSLDLAVNNAGVGVSRKADLAETSLAEWERVIDIDLRGVFLCMRAQITAMLGTGGGAVVNVASVLGMVGARGSSPYVAAKHGVVGLTRTAAIEYAARGVRINAVGPGSTDTAALAHLDGTARATLEAAHPAGRLGSPEEIARAIVSLLSPGLTFTTGAYLQVDGGFLAQ